MCNLIKEASKIGRDKMKTDVLIVGCGCSGLYCALNLPRDLKITIITKSMTERNDSFLAQGGICVQRDDDDFDSFFEDTMKAGHYENDPTSVEIMIKSSRDVISDLLSFGVEFSRDENGELLYTKEGAHSKKRILFHKDITGKEITSKLLSAAMSRDNIEFFEYTPIIDLITENNECVGAVILTPEKEIKTINAKYVVFASGGIGGLFKHSTNFKHLTGDALAICLEHGVELKNISYIQIHPTTLYSQEPHRRKFLISESVRGEGAKLYNKQMERFTNELLPRDLLTKAIYEQMEKDGTEFVWEDLRPIPKKELREHFPNIVNHCHEFDYDVSKECIPVVPAQHYFMGGIKVDYNSKTSMDYLWAVGETACNGVHGKNRLASNSLLESLVFAKRAAKDIINTPREEKELPSVDFSKYSDIPTLKEGRKARVLNEIEKDRLNHV